jgi:alpha-N-arabinofuranosidase
MEKAKISILKDNIISKIDERLFGAFIEHLGRAVYGGLYEPLHSSADENGFRKDVLELISEIKVPVIRYPGGNFVSSYFWEDGIGPREQRKQRMEPAWRCIETNEFGNDEFMKWCHLAGTEPILAINLGTRGIGDAINYLEYCNVPKGTYYSDLRRSNGNEDPFCVKTWFLGNEMDGKWQIGYKTAQEYADLAAKTGKAMKTIDPSIELIVCGSTAPESFPEWEAVLLDKTYYLADYISAHIYVGDYSKNIDDYMASATIAIESTISKTICACDYAKVKKRESKTMMISLDEWGVWYHSIEKDKAAEPWQKAPSLLEEEYNFADALALGIMINAMIRHSDRIRIGCLAQLVNVIAPITTVTGGGLFKQTIFYPYEHALKFAQGEAMNARVSSPEYKSPQFGDNPCLDISSTTYKGYLNFFVVNKSQTDEIILELNLHEYVQKPDFIEHIIFNSADPYKVNKIDSAENIEPYTSYEFDAQKSEIKIPAFSWNVIRFTLKPVPGAPD